MSWFVCGGVGDPRNLGEAPLLSMKIYLSKEDQVESLRILAVTSPPTR
jgi:hypothetical protein